jgi:hypothetical protein
MKNLYNVVAVCLTAALLAACGGAGNTPFPGQQVPQQKVLTANGSTSCTCLYVANYGQHVTVYPAHSSGDVNPTQSITGNKTGLDESFAVALDASREINVVNREGSPRADGSVTVYAAGANGDAAPARTLEGAKTQLDYPDGIALDAKGNLYVANHQSNSVTVYAARSHGNVAPMRVISGGETMLVEPVGLAVDTAGNIYVANTTNTVTVYLAGSNGNVKPIQTIKGRRTGLNGPMAVAVTNGKLYVADGGNNSLTEYSATASGNVAPSATLKGGKTGLDNPSGIALDTAGYVYARTITAAP